MIIKVNDNGTIKSAVLPTKTSELTNDSGFLTTASKSTDSRLVNSGGSIDISTYSDSTLLLIEFTRYGYYGSMFSRIGTLKNMNDINGGTRVIFGRQYTINVVYSNSNGSLIITPSDAAFPNIQVTITIIA